MATEGPDRRMPMRRPQTRWIVLFAIAGFSAVVLASGSITSSLGANAAFLPAMLAVVSSTEALTALVLLQKFLAGGRSNLVGIACAYLFSALLIVPHALAFPGVVTAAGPLAVTPSTSTWLWVAWHAGFAVMLCAAMATGSITKRWTVTQRRRRLAVIGAVSTTVLIAVGLTAVIVLAHESLPAILVNGNFSHLVHLAGWWIIGVNVLAVAVSIHVTRGANGMLAWVPVAAAASLADVTLTLFSESRFTLGWYSGRVLSLVTAYIVLAALLVEFSRLYRASELNRQVLEDEALGLMRDKRAAQDREVRVRRIIENAADAYVEIGLTGVIQAWNGKAVDMFGRQSNEALGRSFTDLVMPEPGRNECLAMLQEFWTSKERVDGGYAELLVMNSDGVEFPVEATMWVDESDEQSRMSFFLRDITIRREMQAKMERALVEEREALLRLQEIDRVKSDFVSSISHELRSPLTNTLGYLELLADGDVGALTDEQLRMVDIAQRNAHRLFSLIEDLLTLSRVEEGAFTVRFRAVPVRDILQEVFAANLTPARERGIELLADIDQVSGICPGDAKQLTRALSNVVNNAVKFSHSGGSVRISARRSGDEMVVEVSDDGIGIPAEELPRLFQRFFRTSVSVEQQYQGAGLGLTITKAIVDHHGGSVEVSSLLGRGTTIAVHLPVMAEVPAVGTPAVAG